MEVLNLENIPILKNDYDERLDKIVKDNLLVKMQAMINSPQNDVENINPENFTIVSSNAKEVLELLNRLQSTTLKKLKLVYGNGLPHRDLYQYSNQIIDNIM